MSTQFEKNSSSSKRERLITSRLTPFEKLPRIGNSHEYIPHPPQSIHLNSHRNPRQKFFEKQQPTILIAIKLSDGRRLQREFSPQNTILDIIKFVKSQQMDIDKDFYLSSGDVPKRQFTDLNLTLLQANISNRTVLFIDRI